MTTLREAALQALEALESHPYDDRHWVEECQPAITALRAALAEQTGKDDLQVEPVAWIQPDHLEKARRSPFLCRVEPTQRIADFVPIYTAPQCQPLTDDQIDEGYRRHEEKHLLVASVWSFEVGVRWAERAHGIGGQDGQK